MWTLYTLDSLYGDLLDSVMAEIKDNEHLLQSHEAHLQRGGAYFAQLSAPHAPLSKHCATNHDISSSTSAQRKASLKTPNKLTSPRVQHNAKAFNFLATPSQLSNAKNRKSSAFARLNLQHEKYLFDF